MKRNVIFWLAVTAAVMVGLPWLAVSFVRGEGGFAVCLLLFFGIDPVYCVFMGLWAGEDWRRRWFGPVASPVLFLLGAWLFLAGGEMDFVWYGGIYLLLGLAVMAVKAGVKAQGEKRR